MKVLVVVDMQKDFIDGALGTAEAETIVPKVREKAADIGMQVTVSYSPGIPTDLITLIPRKEESCRCLIA